MSTVVGIDPGGSWTGVVVRHGRTLLHHDLLQRADTENMDQWLDRIQLTIHRALDAHPDASVAVEGVVKPNPHLGLTNPWPIMETAQVLGCIRTHWDVAVIRPNRHGTPPKALLDIKGKRGLDECRAYLELNYPLELIGKAKRGKDDDLQHCRAAWDVAGSAMTVQARFGITT